MGKENPYFDWAVHNEPRVGPTVTADPYGCRPYNPQEEISALKTYIHTLEKRIAVLEHNL